MARTPLEQMVDRACGVPGGFHEAERARLAAINGHDADGDWLILFCPKCGRFIASERQPQIDPPVATLLEMLCDSQCWMDGSEAFYYDATGRELGPSDWPSDCPTPVEAGPSAPSSKSKKGKRT